MLYNEDKRVKIPAPFLQDETILYVDSRIGTSHLYIEDHLEELISRFEDIGYKFLFLPELVGELSLTAYALWCVVDWFDAIVLDCLWFCHDRHFVIKGTEDMVKDYHDYWFHIKGSLIGMVLAIPAALIAGLIVIL